jgi:hypothetical protein
MNISQKLISALAVTLIASVAIAQTKAEDHKAHHPDAQASAPAASAKSASAPAMAASGGMHGHMSKHCKEMQKIMAIKDPAKRQKAMDEHMKTMKEGDCDMMKDGMGGAMGGGAMGGDMGASSPEGSMKPMTK